MGESRKAVGLSRKRFAGLLIAALVILCLVASGASWLPAAVRLWSSFLLVFLLPGSTISFFRPGRGLDLWERIAASFVGSLVLLVAAGLLSHAVDWEFGGLIALVPVVTVAVALLRWRLSGGAWEPSLGAHSRGERIAVTAILLLILAFASTLTGEMTPGTDAFDHLATVREILDGGELFPLTASYKYPEAPLPDPRKGLFHAGLAAMSFYSGQDPVDVWIWLPKALLPLTLLIVFCLGRSLTGSTAGGLLSGVFWALCFGGAGSRLPLQVGYAHNVSEIASWVLILMLLKFVTAGRKGLLVFSAVGLAACCFIHISTIVLAMAAWGCFLAAALALGGAARRALGAALGRAGLLWLAFGVPAATAKVLMSYAPANPIQLQSQNLLYVAGSMYVVNPMWVFSWLGPAGALSLLVAVWLAFRGDRTPAGLYLVGASLVPVAIVLNPVLVPAFYSIVGYLVERFTWVVPYPYVLAGAVVLCARRLRAPGALAPRLGAAAAAAVIVAAVAATGLSRASRAGADAVSVEAWRPAIEYLRDSVEDPSVVAGDLLTSYAIPAFTKHNIVSTLHQHGSPNDPRGVDRIVALVEIMNPYTDPSTLKRRLREEEVDFILLNGTFDSGRRLYFSEVDPAATEALDRKLKACPEIFREVFRAGKLCIYSVDRWAIEGCPSGATAAAPYLLPAGATPGGNAVNKLFEGEVELVSAELDSGCVEGGAELGITCYWRGAVEKLEFDRPWVVQVRIQRDYPKGRLYRASCSKIYRRGLELLTGERYRWRQSHLPAAGAYPPPMWGSSVIVDRAEVAVPPWMKPGTYEVTVSIGRESVYPNFTVRDFLRDDDRYSGVVVGTVEIK